MWRHKDWNKLKEEYFRDHDPDIGHQNMYEDAADAMHKADIEWLRGKKLTIGIGGTSIFIKDNDWQKFIEGGI